MPYGCKTQEIEMLPPEHVGTVRGRIQIVTAPWCVVHRRWFAECQGGSLVESGSPAQSEVQPNSEGAEGC